jgi:hypothetical protein
MSFAVLSRKSETASASKSKAVPSALRVGKPDDAFEREADRVSDQIVSTGSLSPAWSISRMSVTPPVQRKCDCDESGQCAECREKIQRKIDSAGAQLAPEPGDTAPESVDGVLAASGTQLGWALSADMGERFGFDFSQVRVHSGVAAEKSARDINAKAYTSGNNIVFGSGQFAPATHEGRRLIAHELTHVVQQGGALSAVQRAPEVVSSLPSSPQRAGGVMPVERRYYLELVVPHLFLTNARTYPFPYQTESQAIDVLAMFGQKLRDIVDEHKGLHRELRDILDGHPRAGFWSNFAGGVILPDYEMWESPLQTLYQCRVMLDGIRHGKLEIDPVQKGVVNPAGRTRNRLEQVAALLQIAADEIGQLDARLIEYKEGTEKGAARGVTVCKVTIAVLAVAAGGAAAMEFAAPSAIAAPGVATATAAAAPEVIAGTATAAPGIAAATATAAPEVIATATAAPGVAAAAATAAPEVIAGAATASGGVLAAEETLWSATMRALPKLAKWITWNPHLALSIVGTTLGIAEARLGTHAPTAQDVNDTLLAIIIGLGHAYNANQADVAANRTPVAAPSQPSKVPTGLFARLYLAVHLSLADVGVDSVPGGGPSGGGRPVPGLVDSTPGADSGSIPPARPPIPADMPDEIAPTAVKSQVVTQPTTGASTDGETQTTPNNVPNYLDPNAHSAGSVSIQNPTPAPVSGGPVSRTVDRIHPAAMADLRDRLSRLYSMLSAKERYKLDRNSTISLALITEISDKAASQPRLVYTVAGNRSSKEIQHAADEIGLVRWTPRARAEGRGAVGAPNDSEQLLFEGAEANHFRVWGMVVSRRACRDCANLIDHINLFEDSVEVTVVRDVGARAGSPLPAKPRDP